MNFNVSPLGGSRVSLSPSNHSAAAPSPYLFPEARFNRSANRTSARRPGRALSPSLPPVETLDRGYRINFNANRISSLTSAFNVLPFGTATQCGIAQDGTVEPEINSSWTLESFHRPPVRVPGRGSRRDNLIIYESSIKDP
jgi:hypothetical protein